MACAHMATVFSHPPPQTVVVGFVCLCWEQALVHAGPWDVPEH